MPISMLQPKPQNDETQTIVEQYAIQVLDFSSQYGSDSNFSYTAENCLGVPTRFPQYGDFSPTFVMKDYGVWWGDEGGGESTYDNFIDLKFEHSIYVYSVYVYETLNPGAVTAIFGGNCKGSWSCLWKGPVQKVGHHPRVFSPPIELADFPINQIRIVFNQRHLPYYTEIDAVALLGTFEPSTAEARLLRFTSSSSTKPQGPIMKSAIKQKLYRCLTSLDDVLDLDLTAVGRLCQLENEMRLKPASDDGRFALLPVEVVHHIFGFLSFASLVQCNQVSKLFRRIAGDSILYAKINLKPLFHVACNDTLKFICSKAQHLQEFGEQQRRQNEIDDNSDDVLPPCLPDLSWCGNYGKISPLVFKSFLTARGHNLVKLILSNCHVFTISVVDVLCNVCPNLEDLNLSNCHMVEPKNFEGWNQQRSGCKKLRRLNLYRTQITTEGLRGAIESCSELEYLNIGACARIDDADDIASRLVGCKRLRSLDFWRLTSLTARGVFSLSRVESLQHLDVGWCCNVEANTGCFVALAAGCTRLKKLFVPALRQLSDRDVFAIRDNLGSTIEQLCIMGTRNVSADAVISLARSSTELKLLDIGYCEQLEGLEFLAQLRSILPDCHVVTSFNQD